MLRRQADKTRSCLPRQGKMPKSVGPQSHDAIKRSLKSKFRLILSENKILLDTINGYVKKAEKVYKEMESTDDVTPKQFAKAMEKLERAYSANVRLILVASDLFEKGDSESLKNRGEATISSCDSETSVCSSESSITLTESSRVRKLSGEKSAQRRSRSSDVRLNEGQANSRGRTKPQAAARKTRTHETADCEPSLMEGSAGDSEKLLVKGSGNADCDHLMELQRFLQGLDQDKQQAEQLSPQAARSKQAGYLKHVYDRASKPQPIEHHAQDDSELSPTPSLLEPYRILKNAINSFRDRSPTEERVSQTLDEIKEIVMRRKEAKISQGAAQDVEPADVLRDQDSPDTSSICSINQRDSAKEADQENYSRSSATNPPVFVAKPVPKQKTNNESGGKSRTSSTVEASRSHVTPRQPHPSERVAKRLQKEAEEFEDNQKQHQQTASSDRQPIREDEVSRASQDFSPATHEDTREDINNILVNRIVDMVSAKLAPHLQKSDREDQSSYEQLRKEKVSEDVSGDEPNRRSTRSPTRQPCLETPPFGASGQPNARYNFNQYSQQTVRYQNYQHSIEPQSELQKGTRRQQRQKTVSFVEDCPNYLPCNYYNLKPHYEPQRFRQEESPVHVNNSYMCSEQEGAQSRNFHNSAAPIRFPSPVRRRAYMVQVAAQPQRCFVPPQQKQKQQQLQHQQQQLQQQQQQQCYHLNRQLTDEEDACAVLESEPEMERDEEESEQIFESDSEPAPEQTRYQSNQMPSKNVLSREQQVWMNRVQRNTPKTSYENSDQPVFLEVPRGQLIMSQQGQLSQRSSDASLRRTTAQSPESDTRHVQLQKASPEHERVLTPVTKEESVTLDGVKQNLPEAASLGIVQYLTEIPSPNSKQADYQNWSVNLAEENLHVAGEWLSPQVASPKSIVQLTDPASDPIRKFPTKPPRGPTNPQGTGQQVSSYSGCAAGFGKFPINESCQPTSESSCEASPIFSNDERLLAESILAKSEDSDTKESTSRPQVVCIDANQFQSDASRTITLSNLPLDLNEMELLNIFRKYGHVTKIYYIKDRQTGLFQGRAYGKFSKASEAYQAAKDLQTLVIDGHEVAVQLYVNSPQ